MASNGVIRRRVRVAQQRGAALDARPAVVVLYRDLEHVVVVLGAHGTLVALPLAVHDDVVHLVVQKVSCGQEVDNQIRRQADDQKVDLGEGHKEADGAHDHRVSGPHLDDEEARCFRVRNVVCLVVLHCVYDEGRDRVARKGSDAGRNKGVYRHTPPLGPGVERHIEQASLGVGSYGEEGGVVNYHNVQENAAAHNGPHS